MPVLKISTDSLQTYLGVAEAIIVAAGDYYAHLGPDGVDISSPVFWFGMAFAISRAVKGYYASGVKAEVESAAKPEPVQKVDVVVPQAEVKKEGV